MEDRRIRKTKKNLKEAMNSLLQKSSFDQISVVDLCREADISRITFYTHYSDKYDLIEDMLQEIFKIAEQDFLVLQKSNNQNDDVLLGYFNLLDSILNLYESHTSFLRQMSQRRNPYLYYAFYDHAFKKVEAHIERESRRLTPKIGNKRFSAFVCHGIWAYIDESYSENAQPKEIKKELRALISGILQSDVFVKAAF